MVHTPEYLYYGSIASLVAAVLAYGVLSFKHSDLSEKQRSALMGLSVVLALLGLGLGFGYYYMTREKETVTSVFVASTSQPYYDASLLDTTDRMANCVCLSGFSGGCPCKDRRGAFGSTTCHFA